MADDKKNSPKDTSIPDPKAVKRPYATLDLKATEIKVTPIVEKSSQSIAAEAARLAASAMAGKPDAKSEVPPMPAEPSSYAEAVSEAVASTTAPSTAKPEGNSQPQAKAPAPGTTAIGNTTAGATPPAAPTAAKPSAGAAASQPSSASSAASSAAASAAKAAATSGSSATSSPAAASSTSTASAAKPAAAAASAATPSAAASPAVKPAATAAQPPASGPTRNQRASQPPAGRSVVVKKSGGFLSYTAAGLIGGILALAASEWALPQLGIDGTTSRLADNTIALERRLQTIEKKQTVAVAPDAALSAIEKRFEQRLGGLETLAKEVPHLAEAQSQLVADTKAALAAAASDTGAPEYIERLAKLETQFKALTDAGANDPNSGRVPQLAALTGKVADLETSLQTQVTELRKSVTEAVDARINAVAEASEAAKSGTQRLDRDVAGVKSDAVRLAERLQAIKLESDRLSEAVRLAAEDTQAAKASINSLKSEAAKPADISAAVSPVSEKIASLEKSIDTVVKAEGDRRSSAEQILLSLELQNLKRVIERGQKYAVELEDVQKIAGGKVDLSALEKFKDQGVPAPAELTKDFRATANKVIDAEAEPLEGGVVDRLIAGAKSVVRVRKIGHDAGDKSAEAVIGRMEAALNEGRLSDVLAGAKELPPKAEEAARPFLEKVAARVSVDTAVAALEAQLKSSLNGGSEAAPKATQ